MQIARALAVMGLILVRCPAASSAAEPITVRPGQWTSLGNYYWISPNCVSLLNKVVSVEVLAGGENVALTLQPQTVRTNQCGNEVPGAVVLAAAKGSAPATVQLRYVVNYDTTDGPKMSAHVKEIKIAP